MTSVKAGISPMNPSLNASGVASGLRVEESVAAEDITGSESEHEESEKMSLKKKEK